jgi:hypothetical protein
VKAEKAAEKSVAVAAEKAPAESIDDTDDVRYTTSDFGTFPIPHAMSPLLLDKMVHNVLST